ncbi:MAG TPA: pyridoxal-dependent decarboxylase [Polyangiaceae bacterium]|nr:pyridoxal-dependent decarboxylase [Polyangiaceae bacterium]
MVGDERGGGAARGGAGGEGGEGGERFARDAGELGALLAEVRGAALEFVASLPARPVAAPLEGAPRERPRLPEAGLGARAAVGRFRAEYEPWLSGSAGPRYLGFVTGGTTPAALAGDWLAAAYDQNLSHDGDSAASTVERHALALLRELFGLPDAFEGIFVTGGTQANLVALATARQWAYERAGFDAAERGLAGAPPLRVLGGAPHASVYKALAVLGLGRACVEPVECLPGRRAVDPDALEARLRAGGGAPAIVVASAGEVNTGDFDDLERLADLAERHGAWLHVDGAFGLFAACDPRLAGLVAGAGRADSVASDGHKWLNVPYDAGFVFTRHLALQERVFTASAAYLGAGPELSHRAPENSRRFRALPAFLTLLAYGRSGYRALVRRSCEHAAALGAWVEASPRFELLSPVRLNIVCFAPRAPGKAARDRVLDLVRRGGRAFLTPTEFGGRPAIRAAFSNWSTEAADVGIVTEALAAAAEL